MRTILVAAVLAAGLTCAPKADACGGCFHPPPQTSEPSVVTGHRMAFAVSPTRTVLWDQFEYSGSPQDFSWVLPVKPGAYVELSNDGWFEALDTFTTTQVVSPELQCAQADNSSNGGCGCGSTSASDSAGGGNYAPNTPNVQVTHQGSVGPYDTVTLRRRIPRRCARGSRATATSCLRTSIPSSTLTCPKASTSWRCACRRAKACNRWSPCA